jgi:4-amino-4-deoxy-L-arabinose transferase-like glycosyltransferase
MLALSTFIKKHRLTSLFLVIIIGVASYFRLWNLNEAFHFMGDQGRDALIVSRIITQKDLVFVGPVMSVGNIYLGPFYYYFMLPFLFLSYPSPVGPVYAVAIVNIITVLLVYLLGRKLVGDRAALFASAMMAVSAIAIVHSRFSWNPNIIPFVSLWLLTFSYYAWKVSPKYWIAVGACFGIIVQLHYVTLLSGVAAGLLFIWQLIEQRKNKQVITKILVSAMGGIIVAGALLTPLFLFDMRHDWLNVQAFQELLSDDKNFVQGDSSLLDQSRNVLQHIRDRSSLIIFDKTLGVPKAVSILLLIALVLFLAYYIKKNKNDATMQQGLLLLLLYLIVGIVGFSFYEKDVYDHYIAYLLPVVFLILGLVLDTCIKKHVLGWLVAGAFFAVYLNYNLPSIEFKAGGPTQQELQITADSIHSRVAEGEPYAVVLLSESRDLYGMNYRYFLNTNLKKRPVDPEQNADAQKLFIINEERKTDTPQNLEIYEIIMFDNKQPTEVYTLPQGVVITVLSKNGSITP